MWPDGVEAVRGKHVLQESQHTLKTPRSKKQDALERRNTMQGFLERLPEYLTTYGMRLIAAVLIFLIGKLIARLIARLLEKLMIKSNMDKTLASFLRNLVYFLLLAFVIIAAIDKMGVQTTSLVALIGAAGLAIGFALQGSLSNFAAGVMLIIFRPFKVGDFVEAGGTMGSVQEIKIFSTILRSPDNRLIVVPNSKITGDNITNFTAIDKRRVDLVFGISYDDDIRKAKEVLEGIVKADQRVLSDPGPTIAVSELGDSSVNIVCRPWVKPADYWDVYFETTEKAKIALEAAGLSIPYPQRDVHMFEEKKAA
jgi:small conductance mechanosensitive channel